MIHPGVQFKAVECDALSTNRDLSEVGSDFRVETVTVHAQVTRGIAESEQPGGEKKMLVCCYHTWRRMVSGASTFSNGKADITAACFAHPIRGAI